MNDVFEPLRDIPEPPLRPGSEALATARRDTRRRTALRAAAGALATLAIIGGAAAAADRLRPAAPPPQAATAAAASTTPAAVPTPLAPAPEAVEKHSTRIAGALINAVPTGYQAAPVKLTGAGAEQPDVYTVRVGIPKGGYRAITLVRVSTERGSGVVAAVYGTDLPTPGAGADLCGAHQDLGIEGATITACWTASVGGTPVRLVSGIDPGVGAVMTATRYLRGGYVVVSASQGMRAYRVSPAGETWIWEVAVNPRHEKALAELPFTADRLGALAMDPTLLP